MGAIISTKITRWDGGMVNDPRSRLSNACRVCTNFDALTNPYRLTPYRESENGDSNGATEMTRRWTVALGASSTYRLFGLARQNASDKVQIFYKDLTTSSTDLSDAGWTTTANNTASTNSTVNYAMFCWYPKLNMIFGFHGNRYIFEYDPDGGTAFNETDADLGASSEVTADAIVHPADDSMYVPYITSTGVPTIAKNNNGTWTTSAATFPVGYRINSICVYGSKIAVALRPTSGLENSRVLIWDRDTSVVTFDENIDAGDGNIIWLEELEGNLVGMTLTSGLNLVSTTRFYDRLSFRVFSNYGMQELAVIQGTTSTRWTTYKQKINNRVHFMMGVSLNGSIREGIWSFGRNSLGQWALIHERTPDNDTLTENAGAGALQGFYYVGDYLFQAFVNTSSAREVTKTNNSASYTATSIYESLINPNLGEQYQKSYKQLKSVMVRYASLPSAGQVVLKYKVDGGSYTTVVTETTDNAVYTEMVSAGSTAFTAGREYEFRLESTGGAEILELNPTYEILETNG